MTIEELIIANRESPIRLSVPAVARALFAGSVIVATMDPVPPGESVFDGKTELAFAGNLDKQGRPWAYAYTSLAEFRRAFAGKRQGGQMLFKHFFPLVVKKQEFAGILFNEEIKRVGSL